MLSRNGEMTKMFEKAVGLGVGYLVYKGIMSELAKEPVKEGVKAGQLIGWDKPSEFKEGIKLWSERVGFSAGQKESEPFVLPEWADWGTPVPLEEITFGIGGPLLPEGFVLEGVTKELGRPGLRPKGL